MPGDRDWLVWIAIMLSGLCAAGDDEIRVISFRKATKQEVRRYADS